MNAFDAQIDILCRELKMPGVRKVHSSLAREALEQGLHPSQFLLACLSHEVQSRRESRLRTRLAQAKMPQVKTLESFNFTATPSLPKAKIVDLSRGDFIRAKENLLLIGNSGTGKTHIAIALGIAAIQAGYRVRFIQAITLAQELLQAQQEYRLPRYLKSWQKVDLVILDELGYLGLGPGGPLLFQFCAERYETGSLLVTSNLEFSRWGEVFGDATLTNALLDRLTHHSHVLLFTGESYRFKESQKRATVPIVSDGQAGYE